MMILVEFRESIQPAIPHIISLLSHKTSYARKAGADALSKLSEQGNVFDLVV